MANTQSAIKRKRQAQKRKARNTSVRTAVKTAVKRAREAIISGDASKTATAVSHASTMLRKAASKGVVHKRNASRRIGRLARQAFVRSQDAVTPS